MNNERIKKLAEKLSMAHFEHTLVEGKSDSLDFFEVSVWGLERILMDMYAEGYKDGMKDSKNNV